MNIHPNLEPGQSPREISVARTGASGASPAGSTLTVNPASISDGDQTHLSPTALAAAAASSGTSDLRVDKVVAIQQALASGSYTVSASDVAAKLIDHMLQN